MVCERKLLDFQSKRRPSTIVGSDPNVIDVEAKSKKTQNRKKQTDENEPPAKKGWFARLQEIADQAREQAALNDRRQENSRDKGTGKKSKKRR